MINYLENQRRSVRWDGSSWQEEVLTDSGVEVDSSGWTTVTGSDAHEMFNSIDNMLQGLDTITPTGIVIITDVSNVSGTTGETIDNLDVITLPSGENSEFRFSFSVPGQPTEPLKVQLSVIPRSNTLSGNLKLTCDYNLFEQGVDVTPGAYAFSTGPVTQSIAAADFEKIKLINFQIPVSDFSTAGSAPFLVNCKIGRDVSVGANYDANVSIAQLIVDNVPGGMVGNVAGYTGGNLSVTGDLTVEGNFILANSILPPASGTDTGISGSIVLSENYLYAAVTDNSWKRININSF